MSFGYVRVWRVLSINILAPQDYANHADGIGEGELRFLVPGGGIGKDAMTEQIACPECDETVE